MKTLFVNKSKTKPVSFTKDFKPVLEDSETIQFKDDENTTKLPVDILENNKEILIITPLAGVDLSDAEIVINEDILTIRGKRVLDDDILSLSNFKYFSQECYWGEFERSVILPPNVDSQLIDATQYNQILYIRIPKRLNLKMRIIKIKSK